MPWVKFRYTDAIVNSNYTEFKLETCRNISQLQAILIESVNNTNLIKRRDIDIHNLHHYSLIYMLIVFVFAYALFKCKFKKPELSRNISMPNIQENVQVQASRRENVRVEQFK